jgi:hypothetical protein
MADNFDSNLSALQEHYRDHPNRAAVVRLTAALNDCMNYGAKLQAIYGREDLTAEELAEADELARLALDATERMQAAMKELDETAHYKTKGPPEGGPIA